MGAGLMEYDELAYHGATPWHGQGHPLKGLVTSEEMRQASNLMWEPELHPVYLQHIGLGDEHPQFIEAKHHRAVVRSDHRDVVLGVVSDNYQIIENAEMFDFCDALVDAGAHYETAGSIHNGRRVWALCRVPETVQINGVEDDEVQMYVACAQGHDGGFSLRAMVTPVRIVCQNTLQAALNTQRTFTVRHAGSPQDKLADAQEALGITFNWAKAFGEFANDMAARPMADDEFARLVQHVLPPMADGSVSTSTANSRARLQSLYHVAPENNLPGMQETRWAAFNAVTQYVDWQSPGRSSKFGGASENEFASKMWGGGVQVKQRASKMLRLPEVPPVRMTVSA